MPAKRSASPERTRSRPSDLRPQGCGPRGISRTQSSVKKLITASRSWALKASSRRRRVSTVTLPVSATGTTSFTAAQRGARSAQRSGDEDELSADGAALADAVGLGGAVGRERLDLEHQLVLGQQVGDQRQGLHGAAVAPATADAAAGLAAGGGR